MRLAAPPRGQSLDQVCQLPRRLKEPVLAVAHNCSRKPPGIFLAAVFPKNLCQRFGAPGIDQVRRHVLLARGAPDWRPSTHGSPPSQLPCGTQFANSAKFPCRISNRPAKGARRRRAASIAPPSRSQPYNHPFGVVAAKMAAACPAPPSVPSATRRPGLSFKACSTSAIITGLWTKSGTAHWS